jgi:hypothetical protein
MANNRLYRQGDILFAEVSKEEFDRMPRYAQEKRNESGVIATGETTGHMHRLTGDGTLFGMTDQMMWIVAGDETVVVHDEHAPIQLEKGYYKVIRQREYAQDGWRYVSD